MTFPLYSSTTRMNSCFPRLRSSSGSRRHAGSILWKLKLTNCRLAVCCSAIPFLLQRPCVLPLRGKHFSYHFARLLVTLGSVARVGEMRLWSGVEASAEEFTGDGGR